MQVYEEIVFLNYFLKQYQFYGQLKLYKTSKLVLDL